MEKAKAMIADDLRDRDMEAAKAQLATYKRALAEDRKVAIKIIGNAISVIVAAQKHASSPKLLRFSGQARLLPARFNRFAC